VIKDSGLNSDLKEPVNRYLYDMEESKCCDDLKALEYHWNKIIFKNIYYFRKNHLIYNYQPENLLNYTRMQNRIFEIFKRPILLLTVLTST